MGHCTTSLGLRGYRSNSNEGVHHIHESFRTGASLSDAVTCYIQKNRMGGVLLLRRDAVSVFYSPSRLGCLKIIENELWNILQFWDSGQPPHLRDHNLMLGVNRRQGDESESEHNSTTGDRTLIFKLQLNM